jgi:hypothetical protein
MPRRPQRAQEQPLRRTTRYNQPTYLTRGHPNYCYELDKAHWEAQEPGRYYTIYVVEPTREEFLSERWGYTPA